MTTIQEIKNIVANVAKDYPIKRISLFGSYAENRQTTQSDIDFLIEFNVPAVSLFMLSDIKFRLQEQLKSDVDIIHAPLPDYSMIKPSKVVEIYAN